MILKERPTLRRSEARTCARRSSSASTHTVELNGSDTNFCVCLNAVCALMLAVSIYDNSNKFGHACATCVPDIIKIDVPIAADRGFLVSETIERARERPTTETYVESRAKSSIDSITWAHTRIFL